MFGNHFYNASTRRIVSVFGTLFNNISVVRKDSGGSVKSIQRVPLAYGPKQKFISRIEERPNLENTSAAIKLPRMSFEITGINYDPTVKTSKLNRISKIDPDNGNNKIYTYTHAPYKLSIDLAIMAKNQDDALQIMEQIIPFFQPEYSVTINDIPELNIKSDIPIVLSGIAMEDSYDGDYTTRRAIVYTLSFEARVKYFGPVNTSGVIKNVISNIANIDNPDELLEQYSAKVNPIDSSQNDTYTIQEEYLFAPQIDEIIVKFKAGDNTNTGVLFDVNEYVDGGTYAAQGLITSIDKDNYQMTISSIDGFYRVGETITGATTKAEWEIESILLV
jgi:hypothetical protein